MSSDGHPEYDANLLSTAPAPTKGMVQSGYATDLLDQPSRQDDLESSRHKSHSRHTYVPNRKTPADGPDVIRTKPSPSTEKTPFYRTKRGIIVLVIVAIVLIAAIIGGAVGGALANKKDPDPLNQAPSTTGDLTGDIGSPQGATESQSKPRTTTVTIFPSSPGAPSAPPASDSPLPISISLGIRP